MDLPTPPGRRLCLSYQDELSCMDAAENLFHSHTHLSCISSCSLFSVFSICESIIACKAANANSPSTGVNHVWVIYVKPLLMAGDKMC